MLSKFVKKCSLLYAVSGGNIGQGLQKAKSSNVNKANTVHLRYSCLGLIAKALQEGKSDPPELKP